MLVRIFCLPFLLLLAGLVSAQVEERGSRVILVSGANGTLGGAVARELNALG